MYVASAPSQEDPSLVFVVSKLLPHQVSYPHLTDFVMSLENFPNMLDSKSSFSSPIRDEIQGLAGQDRSVLQTTMDVPTLKPEQVIEAMAAIPNFLCNLAC